MVDLPSISFFTCLAINMEIDDLREEIYSLEKWINTREAQLELALDQEVIRVRHLLRQPQSDANVSPGRGQVEALEKEKESLNEVRQILELKRALLHRLASGSHKNIE